MAEKARWFNRNYNGSDGRKDKNLYVIQIGTKNVTIYKNGVILREPSVAAIKRENGIELLAAGRTALDVKADSVSRVSRISPVEDGAVVNVEVAAMMISDFLARSIPKNIFNNPHFVVAIPCGLTSTEREAVEATLNKAGCRDFVLAESLLGARGSVPEDGALVVLLGGGTTEIGVINRQGIVSGCSFNLAGAAIDGKLAERILDVYNLNISIKNAEYLKREIGSLFENDISVTSVMGKDILDGKIKRAEISSESLRPTLADCYKKILDVAESLLTTIPSSMIADVTAKGVYFGGDGANLRGLAEYTQKYLKIPAHVLPEPETVAVSGLYNYFSK